VEPCDALRSQDPIWPNRDRFVLSNGHASMLLWSVLHLTKTRAVNADYERLGSPSVTLDDIKHFRQLDSKAPDTRSTTGCRASRRPPARSGRASPRASAWPSRRSGSPIVTTRPGFDIFDYDIYVPCGDGCLMEGVASEAASLAGHLGLDNLCWIFDNNHITIEGHTSLTFTEDVAARFLAYQWNVLRVGDANDLERIEHAIDVFKKTKDRPTLIILDSHIGWGSPKKQDTAAARRAARRGRGPRDEAGLRMAGGRQVPRARRRVRALRGGHRRARRLRTPEVGGAFRVVSHAVRGARDRDRSDAAARAAGEMGPRLAGLPADPKGLAGRDASGKVLNVLAQSIPWFLGGSADLGPSNKTNLTYKDAGDFQRTSPGGKNLHFGVREHAMAAAVNGLSLSKLRPFGATFFIFSDYARAAIRLSALMELPTIFVFTHDAMGDGEDGPTHQPVEHLISPARDSRADHAATRRRQRGDRGVSLRDAAAPHARRARAVAAAAATWIVASTRPRAASQRAPTSSPTRPAARRK
jgi:transketolase